MAIFEQYTDENGEVQYREVDLTKLEIPKEVVVNHPAYKEVADSDYKRRKRNAKLQSEIERLSKAAASAGAEVVTTEEDEPEQPAQQQGAAQVPATPPIDPDALYADFRKRFLADQQAAASAAEEERSRLLQIARANGLGASAVDSLALAKDPEALAKQLAANQYIFPDVDGGNGVPDDDDAFMKGVFNKIGI